MSTNLKKVVFYVCFLVFLSISTPVALGAEVSTNDAALEAPGILPSNPFYFFKEWGRSIRRSFSFSELKKAETQLNFLNEQVAELKKLDELKVIKREAFEKAVASYVGSATTLRAYLLTLKALRGTPNLEKFLDTVIDRSLKQYSALDALIGRFTSDDDGVKFDDHIRAAIEQLAKTVAVVPGTLEDARHLNSQVQSALGSQHDELREFNAVAFLEFIEDYVNSEVKNEIMKLKDALLLEWGGRLQSGIINKNSVIKNAAVLPVDSLGLFDERGDLETRFAILDEAREKVLDVLVKNQLNIARQRTLDQLKESGMITKEIVSGAIRDAQAAIDESVKRAEGETGELRAIVKESTERAKFNLAAAAQFVDDESYPNAYAQAVSAKNVARNALVLIIMKSSDFGTELQSIKEYFDILGAQVEKSGVVIPKQSKLAALMSDTEMQIAKASDMVAKDATTARIITIMRALRSNLGAIDQLIETLSTQ